MFWACCQKYYRNVGSRYDVGGALSFLSKPAYSGKGGMGFYLLQRRGTTQVIILCISFGIVQAYVVHAFMLEIIGLI